MNTEWDLEDALKFVRMLKEELEAVGCGVGLTGSVLFRGHSYSDLDVLLYPLQGTLDAGAVTAELSRVGCVLRADRARVTAIWRRKGSTDTKHVETWSYYSKRVDFFFLGGE